MGVKKKKKKKVGEEELKCQHSPLQTFSLSLSSSSPLSSSTLRAQLPQLPFGSELEGRKARKAEKLGKGEDTRRLGPEAEKVVWMLTEWLTINTTVVDECEMPSQKSLISLLSLSRRRGEGFRERPP